MQRQAGRKLHVQGQGLGAWAVGEPAHGAGAQIDGGVFVNKRTRPEPGALRLGGRGACTSGRHIGGRPLGAGRGWERGGRCCRGHAVAVDVMGMQVVSRCACIVATARHARANKFAKRAHSRIWQMACHRPPPEGFGEPFDAEAPGCGPQQCQVVRVDATVRQVPLVMHNAAGRE